MTVTPVTGACLAFLFQQSYTNKFDVEVLQLYVNAITSNVDHTHTRGEKVGDCLRSTCLPKCFRRLFTYLSRYCLLWTVDKIKAFPKYRPQLILIVGLEKALTVRAEPSQSLLNTPKIYQKTSKRYQTWKISPQHESHRRNTSGQSSTTLEILNLGLYLI